MNLSNNNNNVIMVVVALALIFYIFVLPKIQKCNDNEDREIIEKMNNITDSLQLDFNVNNEKLDIKKYKNSESCTNNMQWDPLDKTINVELCSIPNNLMSGSNQKNFDPDFIQFLEKRGNNKGSSPIQY